MSMEPLRRDLIQRTAIFFKITPGGRALVRHETTDTRQPGGFQSGSGAGGGVGFEGDWSGVKGVKK